MLPARRLVLVAPLGQGLDVAPLVHLLLATALVERPGATPLLQLPHPATAVHLVLVARLVQDLDLQDLDLDVVPLVQARAPRRQPPP